MDCDIHIQCSQCGELTYLERMDDARYERIRPALAGVLHALICSHCHRSYGASGGQIVKKLARLKTSSLNPSEAN